MRLAKFDFKVVYKKGKANFHADASSHLRTLPETEADEYDSRLRFRSENEETFTIYHRRDEAIEDANGFSNDDNNEQDECDLSAYRADELTATFPDVQPSDQRIQPIF